LDKRLVEAKEAAAKLEKMFLENNRLSTAGTGIQNMKQQLESRSNRNTNDARNSKESSLSPPPTQTFYHNQHQLQ
jgi:hypothetical protein